MSGCIAAARPARSFGQALRQCRAECRFLRPYATSVQNTAPDSHIEASEPPPSRVEYLGPARGFRPSQAIKQNRFEEGLKKIRVVSPPRSTAKACPDPVSKVFDAQMKVLDPTGARTRLFSKANPERVAPGDILLVRLKNGDPFSGVCMVVRQRNSPIDTAILLRNHLTRVGVEMWFKVYSPSVESIEIVQRKEKRARRAKLYYLRQPRHDMGSVDGIVRQYIRQRTGGSLASRNAKRDGNSDKRQTNRK